MKYIIKPLWRLFLFPLIIVLALLVIIFKMIWEFDVEFIKDPDYKLTWKDFKEYLFKENYFYD